MSRFFVEINKRRKVKLIGLVLRLFLSRIFEDKIPRMKIRGVPRTLFHCG